MLETVGLAVFLFASTDIDDLFVLIAFFADSRLRPRQIAIGQYAGVYGLLLVSYVLSRTAAILPERYLGLLGLAPLLIGAAKLLDSDEGELPVESGAGGALAVAATTLANGGDNIGVYTPVFATRGRSEFVVFAVVFAFMTLAWLALAHWLVNRSALSGWIARHGRRAVPVALICLGVSILYRSGSLRMVFGLIG